MSNNKGKVKIDGHYMSAAKFADARAWNKGCSQYIKARREARKRSAQIRDMSGPASMEWVQSALFLYAVRKFKMHREMKRAIWAYTSALILKLETFVTNSEKIAEREGVADSFHWVALQLRAAVRQHMKLLELFKDEEQIEVPPVTDNGRKICGIVHKPKDSDSAEAMNYMLSGFRQKYPDTEPFMPKPDDS